eukprot:11334920-Alexandrium_andersonii.AAC.1
MCIRDRHCCQPSGKGIEREDALAHPAPRSCTPPAEGLRAASRRRGAGRGAPHRQRKDVRASHPGPAE